MKPDEGINPLEDINAAAEDGTLHSGGFLPRRQYGPTFVAVFWILVAMSLLTLLDLCSVVINGSPAAQQEDDDALVSQQQIKSAAPQYDRTIATVRQLLQTAEEGVQVSTNTVVKKLGDLQNLLNSARQAADAFEADMTKETLQSSTPAPTISAASQQDEERARAGLLQYFNTLQKLEKLMASPLAVEKSLSTQELLAWRSRILGPLVVLDKALLGGHSERYQKLKDIEVALIEVLTRWPQHFRSPSDSQDSAGVLSMETVQGMTVPVYHPIFADTALPHPSDEEGRKHHAEYNAA